MNGRTTGFDQLDESIMSTIIETRERYHACTVRHVGRQLGLAEATARSRVTRLNAMGLVDFNDIPGSLRVTEAPAEFVFGRSGDAEDDVPRLRLISV